MKKIKEIGNRRIPCEREEQKKSRDDVLEENHG